MSISSEITRIAGNVSDSLTAVANKGVTVPSGSTSDDLPGLIAQISGGGTGAISIVDTLDSNGGTVRSITGIDISDTDAVAEDVAAGKYFYTADGTKTMGTASMASEWTVLYDETTTQSANLQIAVTNVSCSEFDVFIISAPTSSVVIYISPNNSSGNHYDAGYGRGMITTGTSTGNNKYGYCHVLPNTGDVIGFEEGDLDYNQSTLKMRYAPISQAAGKYTSISVATYQAIASGTRIIVRGK